MGAVTRILGAILTNRSHAAVGTELHRYLSGYQFSLVVAAFLVAVGVPVAWFTLRSVRTPEEPAATPEPVLVRVVGAAGFEPATPRL